MYICTAFLTLTVLYFTFVYCQYVTRKKIFVGGGGFCVKTFI